MSVSKIKYPELKGEFVSFPGGTEEEKEKEMGRLESLENDMHIKLCNMQSDNAYEVLISLQEELLQKLNEEIGLLNQLEEEEEYE